MLLEAPRLTPLQGTSIQTVICSFQKANIKNVIIKHYAINMTFLTRFEFLKAVLPKIQVFCDVTLSQMVNGC